MKKIIIWVIILIVLGVGGSLGYQYYSLVFNKPAVAPLRILSPLYATYTIDRQKVTLKNGAAETEAAPGSGSKIATALFGEPVQEDLTNDDVKDYAMLITQTTGGSGTFYYAVVGIVNKDTAEVTGTNAILLGDRVAPQNIQIDKGTLIVNYADRNPGEAMTIEPSVGISKYLTIVDGMLVDSGKK